jgi:hypothetical protein
LLRKVSGWIGSESVMLFCPNRIKHSGNWIYALVERRKAEKRQQKRAPKTQHQDAGEF